MSIASLDATPQRTDAPVKMAMPVRNMRVRPMRSPRRPPSSRKLPNAMRYAFMTQVSDEEEKLRSVLIAGRATATIVASRIIIS